MGLFLHLWLKPSPNQKLIVSPTVWLMVERIFWPQDGITSRHQQKLAKPLARPLQTANISLFSRVGIVRDIASLNMRMVESLFLKQSLDQEMPLSYQKDCHKQNNIFLDFH